MWLFAMFDLPVDSPEARRRYTRFRKALLAQGFSMLQFSVYARYCQTEEISHSFRRRVRETIPPEGEVRLISITDRQFGKMEVFLGKIRRPPEEAPDQLMLF
ncbi:MAG: CRISPR-associated endonuclease Cas2 [Armatimonadetes bacterium]|nr:CRISPR-associated endonuclease Cas2 [Armatimonadota bacterium]NIO96519.1 CRISPR-associated endonuclease Cas2 [Armatimonadota bacterium]